MVDIYEQIRYWRDGAIEDLEVAHHLVDSGKNRHGLFFAHLALEKILKAFFCKTTQQLAPRMHNLVRLAELAELSLEPSQIDLLADMNEFNLEGRYPLSFLTESTSEESQEYIKRSKEVFQWLIQKL